LTSGEYRDGKLVKPQSGRVAEIYEILKPDERDIEEERLR
jgi:hypothetical protein